MRKFFIGLLAMMVSVTLFAAPRTAEEAAALAAQFTNQQTQIRHLHRAPRTADQMRMVHQTNKPNTQEAALYVFNHADNGGFVIVSADDNAVEILGYSDEGAFNAANIPSNIKFWLDYYAERVAVAQPMPASRKKLRKATAASAVSPLLTAKWDQGEPYNNMCPMDPADNTRSYTGCVATAAAQIMYYYRWPEHGQGSKTYSWQSDAGGSGTESVNFANATYDWANMKDKHTKNDTQAQKTAIGTLMYHVGVSCKMQYGGDASNGSAAYTNDMMTGLVQNFKYKNTASYAYNKTVSQMTSTFRTELLAGRPVLLGGSTSNNEGHEFVCDGVDADGYFHINWGWSGTSNGYFALSALDPDQQGAGGAASGQGFSHDIDYIIGIEPDRNPISVTGVTVDPSSATLMQKEHIQLTATITPSDASNKGLNWSTSNASVATVSASGVVIGVSAGTAVITATTNDGNKTATCSVTVTDEVAEAELLDVNTAGAEYDSQYEDPWTIHVYNANNEGSLPYIMFFPSCQSTSKIAGSYTLGSQGGGLYNNPNDPDEDIAITGGQLTIACVGKNDGDNGCNTYRIISTFTCEDGTEYRVDATMEICAEDASENPITLTDNAGDGMPIEITWMANGEEFASNIAVDGKLSLPAGQPDACNPQYSFVGWSATQIATATDTKPAFAKNNDIVTANKTYYAVFAIATGGSTTVLTDDYQKITSTADLANGNYLVVGEKSGTLYAMKHAIRSNYYIDVDEVSATNNIISTTDADLIWKITVNGNNLTFLNEASNEYVRLYQSGTHVNAGFTTSTSDDIRFTYSFSNSSWDFVSTVIGYHLEFYGRYTEFAAYQNAGDPIYLFKQQEGQAASYSGYITVLNCDPTAIENCVVAPKAVKLIENGQIVIIRDNEKYTIFGQKIK